MKFKNTMFEEVEAIRHNENIRGRFIETKKIEEDNLKRTNGAVILYNIINVLWPYDILNEDKEENEILSNIFNKIKTEINRNSSNYENLNIDKDIDNLISFENASYLILDTVNDNDKKYLFIINNERGEQDSCIVRKNDQKYEEIEDDDEFSHILYNVILDFEEDILNLI